MFENVIPHRVVPVGETLGIQKQLGEDLICANVWLNFLERHPPPKQKVLVKKSVQSDKIPDISPFAFKIYISCGKRKGAIGSAGGDL